MRNGLIAALSLVVIAAASTTFANAPFFTGNIPDVCIGDNEDRSGAGLTVDNNFFRYLNAINILDYVDDTDSATEDLKFAFFEATDAKDVSINDAEQVANPEEPGTWGADTITNPWLSFRDLVRSPAAGTIPFPNPTEPDGTTEIADGTEKLLPWHNNQANLTELSDDDRLRDVWIVACDEDGNLVSKSMLVYSMNSGDDTLSSGVDFTTLLDDSDPSTTNWTGTGTVPHLTKATTAEGAGYIEMSSATQDASGDGYWGRWRQNSPGQVAPIDYVETANVIYVGRVSMELTAATGSLRVNAPNIRLGVSNQAETLTTMNVIKSTVAGTDDTHNPHLPTVGETRWMDVYWARNEQLPDYDSMDLSGTLADFRRFRMFFDILDPDGSGANKGGTWRLKRLVVGTIPRPADLTVGTLPANTLAFLLDDVTASPFTGEGTASTVNGSIEETGGNAIFHSTGTAGGKSVILYNASAFAPWMTGKLMRVIAKLSCVAAGDRSSFGQARVRHETGLGNVNQEFIVKRLAGILACVPAAGTQTPYEIYVPSYGGPNQAIADLVSVVPSANLFKVAVDHLNFATGADPTNWVLHSMQYELLDEPTLP